MKRRIFLFSLLFTLLIPRLCYSTALVTYLEESFLRSTGPPVLETVTFEAGSGWAKMIVTAGSLQDGEIEQVSSSRITLNGVPVCGPEEFNQGTVSLEKEILLVEGVNTMEVVLMGKPGGLLQIRIEKNFPSFLTENATWSGKVLVKEFFKVMPGAILKVRPGTRVMMTHYRGYRNPEKRIHFLVAGGIQAIGSPEAPIYFSSDAQDPQNGDWSMMRLLNPQGPNVFRYCVFEFAQQGLNVWNGDITATNCVFRWNNWEGIYFESTASAYLGSCQLMENGYNGLAAEQFNTIEMDNCEVWRNGTNGIHVDASTLEIKRSLVHDNGANGLSVDDNGTLNAYGVASYSNNAYGLGQGQGTNVVEVGNLELYSNGSGAYQGSITTVATSYWAPSQVDIGFEPEMGYALDYIPSDPLKDPYLYVYPDDETREIEVKIGEGLGLTWSVTWDGSTIWTATVNGKIYQLDPVSGAVLDQFNAPGSQPWGMTWDGAHLWVVDFAEKRISKVDPSTGAELASFPTPDPLGGCKGVAWDGTYLNVMGWTTPTIYRMRTDGTVASTINVQIPGNAGGIAWDGSHFWIPAGKLMKVNTTGQVVGWIYPASEGTWDMTWDSTNKYLWATQRTNENWSDAKIYGLKITNIQPPPP